MADMELNDLGFKKAIQLRKEMDKHCVLVGLPGRNSPMHKETTVAKLGVIHEFGSPANGIPARPFMAQTAQKHRRNTVELLKRNAKAVLNRQQSPKQGLGRIGVVYEGYIKDTIRNGDFVPNAPSTVRMKGSSRPLIDTGLMRASVTSVVADDKAKGTV